MDQEATKTDDIIILNRGENTQCTINLHGCSISSWRVNNWEQLFVSRHSKYQKHNQIVGGITMDFPKVGQWIMGPANGFARISKWEVVEGPSRDAGGNITVTLRLIANPYTRSFWNFSFEIINKVTLQETSLVIHTTIKNTDAALPMRFNILFPIFFQVPDIKKVHVKGFHNTMYLDGTKGDCVFYTDRKMGLHLPDWTYRIYRNVPSKIEIDHIISDYTMKLAYKNFNDVSVWNPGPDHGHDIKDFRPDQYKEMIFIGMGNIFNEKRLLPGEQEETNLTLEVWNEKGLCNILY